MKKTNLFLGFTALTVVLLTSCGGAPKEVEKVTIIATLAANAEDTLVDKNSRFQGEAHSGQYMFRTDSMHQYGATMKFDLNDSLINSNLRVILSFWAKSNNPSKGDGMAVSFQDDEKNFVWATIDPISYGAKPNEWINIIDSVNVPAEHIRKTGLYFKFFSISNNKQNIMDVDDIKITIKKVETTTED